MAADSPATIPVGSPHASHQRALLLATALVISVLGVSSCTTGDVFAFPTAVDVGS